MAPLRTTCGRGHPWSEGEAFQAGKRYCIICKRDRQRERRGTVRPREGRPQDRTHCPEGHEYTVENTRVLPTGRRCITCERRRTREHPRKQVYSRSAQVRRYGITLEQYDAMLESQGGVCSICSSPPSEIALCVDHDHACCSGDRACGRCVRGLICRSCNSMLGGAQDDVDRLLGGIEYLRRWTSSHHSATA